MDIKTETLYSADDERFSYSDIDEAICDHMWDLEPDDDFPVQFSVYSCEFKQMPASHYLYLGDMFERMDEQAYDLLGEDAFERMGYLFADVPTLLHTDVIADVRKAIDAVFTARGIQPKAMVAAGPSRKYIVEATSTDEWRVLIPDASQ